MDRLPDWRPVEAEAPDGREAVKPAPGPADALARWRALALAAGGAALLASGALLATLFRPSTPIEATPGLAILEPLVPDGSAPPAEEHGQPLMVDVTGAVEAPGLYRLPADSRVGDAIAAAGGYSLSVDIEASAAQLNLARPLADGDKVHVPRRGEAPPPPLSHDPVSAPTGATGAGLIDVNSADQRLLETLPGIGPVTAGKIIAARSEAPFATVDDLLGRKVVGPATFEKIRPLISVGP
jgi:competence protein ComEA